MNKCIRSRGDRHGEPLIPGLAEFFGPEPQRRKPQDTKAGRSRRREHPGAPTLGLDYGLDYSESGAPDGQGYLEASGSVVPVDGFDFEAVYRDLDGASPQEARDAVMRLAAVAMSEMLEWVEEEFASPDSGVRWSPGTSLRCKLALLRLYRAPESLGSPTLEQLAHRLGLSKQRLSLLWREFKGRFPGVVAPWEKSEAAKEASRAAHQAGAQEGDTGLEERI